MSEDLERSPIDYVIAALGVIRAERQHRHLGAGTMMLSATLTKMLVQAGIDVDVLLAEEELDLTGLDETSDGLRALALGLREVMGPLSGEPVK
jgi:hypothetical protein